ncbi:MAG: hypothetical protein A2Z47_06060 [Thermodesulfovibrio sp. RBG_19FT_COMBO_42_12]|nr:MAG: hypothetical protein A2Z47_06060 [Thermodesulfovibrio sp. RBG_19FT_COMBO_42_12]
MKKSLSVLVIVIAVISICSIVYAFEGKGRGERAPKHELLSQLPADKEMLFHQTMREVREKTAENRGQIKKLKKEILDVLTAPAFDDEMFLEKIKSMQILRQKERQIMVEGFAKIAKQFTQEERKILAQIIPLKHRHHGRHATR